MAELLLTNANILTLDKNNGLAGSVAVKEGKIIGIWEEGEPPHNEVAVTCKTEVINLKGKTLIPGFIETHNHILLYSLDKKKVNCGTPPNNSIQDILKKIREKANETPKGDWILGYGYDDTLLQEKRHPKREDLDKIAPDHPVYITHISNHFAVTNTKALDLAGLNENTPDPEGGHLGRDSNGRLDGVLYELAAMNLIQKHVPEPTVEEMTDALKEGVKDFLAKGITTNTDAGVGIFYGESELEAHITSSQKGINPMRSRLMVMHELLQTNSKFGNYSAQQVDMEIRQMSYGKARLDSAKMFQDGSIQGLTGALREPYYQNPDLVGDLIYEQQELNEKVADLHKRGFRIAIHGNGDRAIGSILEAYEKALKNIPREDHRHRIEHVQTATVEDLKKMQQLKVAGSIFINHVYYWGERHQNIFLGPERAKRISPLAEMKERNILYTLHSDCPVTPASPLFCVWAAVNRLTSKGEVLGPDQRIDVISALKAMTIYGAKLNFTEGENGSIEVGKVADFAVLDRDPTAIDPAQIKDIEVEATIIDGELEYEKSGTLLG